MTEPRPDDELPTDDIDPALDGDDTVNDSAPLGDITSESGEWEAAPEDE